MAVNFMNNFNKYHDYNQLFLTKLSTYLNDYACSITKKQIKDVTSCGVNIYDAYFLLLCEYLELDKVLKYEYLTQGLHEENPKEYINNAYYNDIHFEQKRLGKWTIKNSNYKAFELFVRDDFRYTEGKVIPQLGFFKEDFSFPAIYENNRLWMSITPNEINTMKDPIHKATGHVLTFGLGLGYFSYMVSLKSEVIDVTIVEKDEEVIALFKKVVLPKFKTKEKFKIILDDAYHFTQHMDDGTYDFVFVDIYHDASDGLVTYNIFKEIEKKFSKTNFSYWIEKTIQYYKNLPY